MYGGSTFHQVSYEFLVKISTFVFEGGGTSHCSPPSLDSPLDDPWTRTTRKMNDPLLQSKNYARANQIKANKLNIKPMSIAKFIPNTKVLKVVLKIHFFLFLKKSQYAWTLRWQL